MSASLIEEGRKLIEAEVRQLVAKAFPKNSKSPTEDRYNEYMRRGSNLMVGLTSSERARKCKTQVLKAIELFEAAHRTIETRWHPINAIAKCHYLLGSLDEAQFQNKHALLKAEGNKDRECSHFLLDSQIYLDRCDHKQAERSILEAISILPRNVHARKAHLRILSSRESESLFEQIEIVQNFDEFPRWANDFITVIDGENDFAYLRKSEQWPEIRKTWLEKIEEALNAAEPDVDSSDSSREPGYKRLARVAALVGIGIGMNVVFNGVIDFFDTQMFSGDESASVSESVGMLGAGDVEPFSQVQLAGDVEPFALASEMGGLSNSNPLAEANIWAHDMLIA